MGCNYICDNSENDFELLNNNQNYILIKNKSKKINKEPYIKSVIDDYKILNQNSKKIKKISLKSKKKEVYPFLRNDSNKKKK